MELHDHAAERSLIGAALIDPRVTAKVGNLPPDSFHDPSHALIWRAMLELGDADFDATSVKARLAEIGAGTREQELLRVAEETALSAANCQHYAEIILWRAQRRRLVHVAEKIDQIARSWKLEGPEVIAEAEAAFTEAISTAASRTRPRSISEGMREYIYDLRDAKQHGGMLGLRTGIPGIDRATKGLRPGEMIVIAARPGCGKSVLADQIAANVARGGGRVLAFNLEMKNKQLAGRQFVRLMRRTEDDTLTWLETDEGQAQFWKRSQEVSALPIDVEDASDMTIGEIRAIARRHKLEHPDLALITIDFLGLVAGGLKRVESREREMAHVARQVKNLASELAIPVLLLAQLNRESEKQGREPQLHNLRESGEIEAAADMVIFIHHDGEVHDGPGGRAAGEGVPADLIIAKNRRRGCGRVAVWFRQAWSLFEERAPDDPPVDAGEEPPPTPFKDRYGKRGGRRR